MTKTVIGVFSSQGEAESAVRSLTQRGFSRQEISVVTKDSQKSGSRNGGNQATMQGGNMPTGAWMVGNTGPLTQRGEDPGYAGGGNRGNMDVGNGHDDASGNNQGSMTGGNRGNAGKMTTDDVSDGISTGTLLGGLGGLLVGAGALAIPGLGPIVAAGPIAAALTGAVTGGIAGGLLDFGIPAERSRHYENEVKGGKILTVIRAPENQVDDAVTVFRQNGANDVEIH